VSANILMIFVSTQSCSDVSEHAMLGTLYRTPRSIPGSVKTRQTRLAFPVLHEDLKQSQHIPLGTHFFIPTAYTPNIISTLFKLF